MQRLRYWSGHKYHQGHVPLRVPHYYSWPALSCHTYLQALALAQHLAPLARLQRAPDRLLAADNAHDVACATKHDTCAVQVREEPQRPCRVAPHQADHDNVVLAPLRCVRRDDPSSVHQPMC